MDWGMVRSLSKLGRGERRGEGTNRIRCRGRRWLLHEFRGLDWRVWNVHNLWVLILCVGINSHNELQACFRDWTQTTKKLRRTRRREREIAVLLELLCPARALLSMCKSSSLHSTSLQCMFRRNSKLIQCLGSPRVLSGYSFFLIQSWKKAGPSILIHKILLSPHYHVYQWEYYL